MKLCASNIAWTSEQDHEVYSIMQALGFEGLEIAPSRVFQTNPYDHIKEAQDFAVNMKKNYGLNIASMQSILYGMTGRIAGTPQERRELQEYMYKAVKFADAMKCRNIVFGCPKNRKIERPEDAAIIEEFLTDAADKAQVYGVVIALEANPEIYGTNFVNTTLEALEVVSRINHPALKVNLDAGTMLINSENPDCINGHHQLISHVHISEPELAAITSRPMHEELSRILRAAGYSNFVSIEMRKQSVPEIMRVMKYIVEVFA